MNSVLKQMLNKYETNSLEDEKNALKEVIQEVILCGLSRAGFFKEVAFYGGTALRIFYGLDRFSEDLDFSLCSLNPDFDLTKYFPILEQEIKSVGLNFKLEEKEKTKESNIKSAFLKGNTKEHILTFYKNEEEENHINKDEVLKIKFEVDTCPPEFANYETKFGLLPSPYQVKLYDMPSLFAGKIHAVICRTSLNRVKGRDLYDFVFYISLGTPINLKHLKARFIQSNFKIKNDELTIDELRNILIEKFNKINFEEAKKDVYPFIKDKSKIDIWSKEFFIEISKNLKAY